MISQQRLILNDNHLHTLIYRGLNGITQLLISRLSGMEIMTALSLSNHYLPEPEVTDMLLQEIRELYPIESTLPSLIQRYYDSGKQLHENQPNTKQSISIYATLMQVRIKEYQINQKNQLFCNTYIPDQYHKTIYIYQCGNNTTYLPLINTQTVQTIMAMEEMLHNIQSNDIKNYEFDLLFDESQQCQQIKQQQLNFTPEKQFVRRHKKSLSDHQIFEFQRYQTETPIKQDKNTNGLFFSQSKDPNYEFPPLNQQDDFEYESFTFPDSSELNIQSSSPSKKNGVITLYTGRLKFFDEQKNYGFIVMDEDKSDIFVHLDDLQKAGVTKELLKTARQGSLIRFQFTCMVYVGKYKKSRKAVELKLLSNPYVNNYKGFI